MLDLAKARRGALPQLGIPGLFDGDIKRLTIVTDYALSARQRTTFVGRLTSDPLQLVLWSPSKEIVTDYHQAHRLDWSAPPYMQPPSPAEAAGSGLWRLDIKVEDPSDTMGGMPTDEATLLLCIQFDTDAAWRVVKSKGAAPR